MTTTYQKFLEGKQRITLSTGFDVPAPLLNPKLHLFQRDIVRWAIKLGKAAIFAQVGLGKTFMQLEWANHVAMYTHKPVLVLAPLAVGKQTEREGGKFGIDAYYLPEPTYPLPRIVITNYERLAKFDPSDFGGVVLDESSILKNYTGKTKQALESTFADTAYKLCCSATPAPNDYEELGNHAQFLGVASRQEMLATWFTHDSGNTQLWRLKGHASDDFWRWITSWAVCITRPGDLGAKYDMPDYDLPGLNLIPHVVAAPQASIERAHEQGMLLPDTKPSSTDLAKVKRESIDLRIEALKQVVSELPENAPVQIWCMLNDESAAIAELYPDAHEVKGSDSAESKAQKLLEYSDGTQRMIITKPSIAGFGMNWQHCHEPIFFGMDFKFEAFHQAIGRNYRYGQTEVVNAHIIFSETEGSVIEAIERKRKQFEEMQKEMAKAMNKHGLFRDEQDVSLNAPLPEVATGNGWTLYLGDCVEQVKNIQSESVGLSVYSPPFSGLYVYSNFQADMGNSSSDDEFFEHYKYLIREQYRVTIPGRLSVVHVSDLPMFKQVDGHIGVKDFSGQVIQAFSDEGWIYQGRITIWKDPVVEMQRTKSHSLLHKTFTKDASKVRVGMPDYLLLFRKPGENQPVSQNRQAGDYIGENPPANPMSNADQRRYSIEVWQRYASPVWFDIDQSNTLNYRDARSENDERHICPLQLDVIARSIDLWSNEGDTVFSPFAGIGSEGYEALKMNRKFIGIELKPEYFNNAVKFLKQAEREKSQRTLWDLLPESKAAVLT